jgi:selenocysteine lyase/cysteine desulfurase
VGDRIAEGATAKGYEVLGKRTPTTGAGIVSIRHPATDNHLIVRRLRDLGIIAAPRQGWVRMAPHFYISPDEIDRVLGEL